MRQDSLVRLGLIFLCQYTIGDMNGYVMVQKLRRIAVDSKTMGDIRDGWTVAIWRTIHYWISALRCLENRIYVSAAASLMTTLLSANKRIQNYHICFEENFRRDSVRNCLLQVEATFVLDECM